MSEQSYAIMFAITFIFALLGEIRCWVLLRTLKGWRELYEWRLKLSEPIKDEWDDL